MSDTARRLSTTALAGLPVAVIGTTATAWWSRLPATLPTHWPGLGLPDGFSSRTPTLVVALVVAGTAAVTIALAAWRGGPGTRFSVAIAGVAGGGAIGVWWAIGSATLAAGSAEAAELGSRLLPMLGAMALGAALGWLPPRAEPPPPGVSVQALALSPGERAAWSTVLCSAPVLAATGLALVVVAVVAVFVEPAVWPVVLVPLLVLLVFSRVDVTVDRRGLRVTAGLLRLTLQRIPLGEITAVRAETVRPADWGGWGYRITPGASALVLRAGPALVVVRHDGRRFAVTVDDPSTPAALLEGLRGEPAST